MNLPPDLFPMNNPARPDPFAKLPRHKGSRPQDLSRIDPERAGNLKNVGIIALIVILLAVGGWLIVTGAF